VAIHLVLNHHQGGCHVARQADALQTGIGIEADPSEAMKWYKQAAEGGDKRAQKRLVGGTRGQSQALDRRLELEAMKEEHKGNANGKGDGCVVM
jgi:TPR repeat protein